MTRKYKSLRLDLNTDPKRELDLLENLEKTDLDFKFEEGEDINRLLIDPYSFKKSNILDTLRIISKSLKINRNNLSFYYKAITVDLKEENIYDLGKIYLTKDDLIKRGGSSKYIKYENGQFYFITAGKIYSDAPTWINKFKIIEITPNTLFMYIRNEIFITVSKNNGTELTLLGDLMSGFFRDNPELEDFLFNQFKYMQLEKAIEYEINN